MSDTGAHSDAIRHALARDYATAQARLRNARNRADFYAAELASDLAWDALLVHDYNHYGPAKRDDVVLP